MSAFSLSHDALDVARLRARVEDPRAGAVVCFEGAVRNHQGDRAVLRLAYQSYTELALVEGEAILAEALELFAIEHAVCVHRMGELAIGDIAVCVAVSAAHRDAAFVASRHIIDEVKKRVPIWKKEFYADGESEWLHP